MTSAGDAATDELDATTFDPNATQPNKYILFGATDRTFNLAGLWNAEVETYFSALDGQENVPYEYGPLGDSAGKPIIFGLCNVGAWSGPAQTALGLDHVYGHAQSDDARGDHGVTRGPETQARIQRKGVGL